jgi:hypothetical protein
VTPVGQILKIMSTLYSQQARTQKPLPMSNREKLAEDSDKQRTSNDGKV